MSLNCISKRTERVVSHVLPFAQFSIVISQAGGGSFQWGGGRKVLCEKVADGLPDASSNTYNMESLSSL